LVVNGASPPFAFVSATGVPPLVETTCSVAEMSL